MSFVKFLLSLPYNGVYSQILSKNHIVGKGYLSDTVVIIFFHNKYESQLFYHGPFNLQSTPNILILASKTSKLYQPGNTMMDHRLNFKRCLLWVQFNKIVNKTQFREIKSNGVVSGATINK